MKKISVIFLILSLFISCNKMTYNGIESNDGKNVTTKSNEDLLKSFAILLSKAMYNEPSLREFIKSEALLRVDMDYDVVYPLVKNKIIVDDLCFDDILRKYDTDEELNEIIKKLPLLTVMVPDWSWVNDDCFSPYRWDVSIPHVGVSYDSKEESHEIFHNGECAFIMKNGEFADVPIMIVKENDRLIESYDTKTGESSLNFICDEFIDISSCLTKSTSEYTDFNLSYTVATNEISTSLLKNRALTAYSTTKNTMIPQRDHIYYGMTSSVSEGTLNKNYYERLYKFKISPSAFGCFDDPIGETSTGNDFKTSEYYYQANTWGNATSLTVEELASKSWGEGSLEIIIKVYAGNTLIKKGVSVSFSKAFSVKKVRLRENFNWLGALKSRTYYLDISADHSNISKWLEPKWIVVNYDLFYWDIKNYPTNYTVEFLEHDAGTTQTTTTHKSFSYMTNFKVSGTVIKKIGYEFGGSATTSKESSYAESYTQEDDDLMNFNVSYGDKIILSQDSSKAKIKVYSTGYVDAMIIPRYE